MQEWQENPLCPSPAAADLSKDIPASCILLMSRLPQPSLAFMFLHFEMCVCVISQLHTFVWLVKGCCFGMWTASYCCFFLCVFSPFDLNLFDSIHLFLRIKRVKPCHNFICHSPLPFVCEVCILSSFNLFISTSFYVFPLCSIVLSLSMCLCLFVFYFPSLQIFVSASGSSQRGEQVWLPAASLLPHRALWCWAHSASASATGSST